MESAHFSNHLPRAGQISGLKMNTADEGVQVKRSYDEVTLTSNITSANYLI